VKDDEKRRSDITWTLYNTPDWGLRGSTEVKLRQRGGRVQTGHSQKEAQNNMVEVERTKSFKLSGGGGARLTDLKGNLELGQADGIVRFS